MSGNVLPAQQQQQQQQAGQQGVQVLVRVRPMLPRELNQDNAVEVLTPQELVVFRTGSEFASVYDHVLGPESTQQDLYQTIQGGVLSALQGYNCSVVAYGQTGTGKTHTMLAAPGADLSAISNTAEAVGGTGAAAPAGWAQLGVMPRAITDLFRLLRQRETQEGIRINVAASYLEIYNDRIFDLLQPYYKGKKNKWDQGDPRKARTTLDVREDKHGITYVPHALLAQVSSLSAVVALLSKGAKNRAVRHTEMNIQSSRSHAILQLVIEQFAPGVLESSSCSVAGGRTGTRGGPAASAGVLRSKVNFVDLAGSERWNKGADMDADRVGEMTAINSSLTALASVVAALTPQDKGRRSHVPYRDSKLTHLLQDSLGGNCRTFIIATVSPAIGSFEETVSTLKFADRARAIRNNPVVNMSRDLGSVLALKEREIQRLRGLLAMYMTSDPVSTGNGAGASAIAIAVGTPSSSSSNVTYDPAVAAAAGAQDLLAELKNTRRALLMERQLREDLQAQLMRTGTADDGRAGLVSPGLMSPIMASPARVWNSGSGTQQQGTGTPSMAATPYDYLRVATPDKTDSDSCLSPGSQAGYQHQHPFKTVMARRAELGLLSPGQHGKGRSYASTYAMRRTHSSGLISSAQGQLISTRRNGVPNSPGRCSLLSAFVGAGDYKVGSPLAPTFHNHSMQQGQASTPGQQMKQHGSQPTSPHVQTDSAFGRTASVQQHVSNLRSIYGPTAPPPIQAVRRNSPKMTDTHLSGVTSDNVDEVVGTSMTPAAATPHAEPATQQLPDFQHDYGMPGGKSGWGRHAIMSNQVTGQNQADSATAVADVKTDSGTGTGIASLGAGWGRAAVLAHGAQGQSAVPANSTVGNAEGAVLRHGSAASADRSSSAQRTGRLDKASMIFIMGPSTSSIRAKQMAAALSDTPWG